MCPYVKGHELLAVGVERVVVELDELLCREVWSVTISVDWAALSCVELPAPAWECPAMSVSLVSEGKAY